MMTVGELRAKPWPRPIGDRTDQQADGIHWTITQIADTLNPEPK